MFKALRPITKRPRAATAATLLTTGFAAMYMSWNRFPEWFADRNPVCGKDEISAGVIFTGTSERYYRGLHFLNKGRDDVILISGFNGSGKEHALQAAASQRRAGPRYRIYLDRASLNTAQNAQNSAAWLANWNGPKICRVDLITSSAHMMRSMFLLNRAMNAHHLHVPVIPAPVMDGFSRSRLDTLSEMAKTGMAIIGIEQLRNSAYRRPKSPKSPILQHAVS